MQNTVQVLLKNEYSSFEICKKWQIKNSIVIQNVMQVLFKNSMFHIFLDVSENKFYANLESITSFVQLKYGGFTSYKTSHIIKSLESVLFNANFFYVSSESRSIGKYHNQNRISIADTIFKTSFKNLIMIRFSLRHGYVTFRLRHSF